MIGYQVSEVAHVELSLYDITGRAVQQMVNEEQQAGSREVVLEGYGLSSGVYYCRLLINGKMVAVKRLVKL